ncbi:hypothetical protein RNZ50_15870 [Paracoccaceae bacterium Fryx2]|nr:hypothetical protein [Paracoccaceae bacterium Fryx2]
MTAQNGAKRVPTIARNQRPFSAKSAAVMFPSPAAITLDGQLYSDLRYGEIIVGMSGIAPVTNGVTRIAAVGSGTKVSIKIANQAEYTHASSIAWQKYWANGGTACPRLGALLPPS